MPDTIKTEKAKVKGINEEKKKTPINSSPPPLKKMSTKAGNMMNVVKKDVRRNVRKEEGGIMMKNFGNQLKKRVLQR